MVVLGLHFGHDASAAVVKDGHIASCVLRERQTRVKHAISLDCGTIEKALAAAGVSPADVDCVACASTQSIELITDGCGRIAIQALANHATPFASELLRSLVSDPSDLLRGDLLNTLANHARADSIQGHLYRSAFPEYSARADYRVLCGALDVHLSSRRWRGHVLKTLERQVFGDLFDTDVLGNGFHIPICFTFDERAIPGIIVNHHMAHASAVFFRSGVDTAGILTHDGFSTGDRCLSGMLFWGESNRIRPITPHHLFVASVFETVGNALGLGPIGSAGKLMGLASYGRPAFFERRFVGNWYDWCNAEINIADWLNHCHGAATSQGYDPQGPDLEKLRTECPPMHLWADTAASTQKLFEETLLATVTGVAKLLRSAGRPTTTLCMSGGAFLNCPTNTRIHASGLFDHVLIEPTCDDSGIAIGAALFLYRQLLKGRGRLAVNLMDPYLGPIYSDKDLTDALDEYDDQFDVCIPENAADSAARDVASGLLVGWFEGRSEIGPRALGHRSILADPRIQENHERVNRVKGRQLWRPFAPAVLASEAYRWFEGLPRCSPHMLFNGRVVQNGIPAVTHADRSARIQTVDKSNGALCELLIAFHKLTGVPILLNTSFNGPGEPIVESPQDALAFLWKQELLGALYLERYRVSRRPKAEPILPAQS